MLAGTYQMLCSAIAIMFSLTEIGSPSWMSFWAANTDAHAHAANRLTDPTLSRAQPCLV